MTAKTTEVVVKCADLPEVMAVLDGATAAEQQLHRQVERLTAHLIDDLETFETLSGAPMHSAEIARVAADRVRDALNGSTKSR